MDFLNALFYKRDNETGQLRLSKTKVITSLVFIIFFLFAVNLYFNSPEFVNEDKMSLFVASIIFGLFFAVPAYIIGWLISKFLSGKQTTTTIVSNNDFVNLKSHCPHDYAIRFKEAIEANDSDLAEELLYSWDVNDANYKYASIIFEGMPPTELSLVDLNERFKVAETMKSCDESLRLWYQTTAIQVINLNK
ncbi:MAG: hypothetical protein E7Z85_07545 [Methanosphaera stadtmanae]|nr:hypothetical protein [Methanosphaera stadtmanae]